MAVASSQAADPVDFRVDDTCWARLGINPGNRDLGWVLSLMRRFVGVVWGVSSFG